MQLEEEKNLLRGYGLKKDLEKFMLTESICKIILKDPCIRF